MALCVVLKSKDYSNNDKVEAGGYGEARVFGVTGNDDCERQTVAVGRFLKWRILSQGAYLFLVGSGAGIPPWEAGSRVTTLLFLNCPRECVEGTIVSCAENDDSGEAVIEDLHDIGFDGGVRAGGMVQ